MTLETNCRPATPLNVCWQFGRAVHGTSLSDDEPIEVGAVRHKQAPSTPAKGETLARRVNEAKAHNKFLENDWKAAMKSIVFCARTERKACLPAERIRGFIAESCDVKRRVVAVWCSLRYSDSPNR